MFLNLFFFCCVIQLLLNCKTVTADENNVFHRFIVEEGIKPAIFGSYNYDPIKQVFEPKKARHDRPQIVNSSYVLSTAVGITEDHRHHHNTSDAIYRHHVTIVTSRPTQWWARKLPKNMTNTRSGTH